MVHLSIPQQPSLTGLFKTACFENSPITSSKVDKAKNAEADASKLVLEFLKARYQREDGLLFTGKDIQRADGSKMPFEEFAKKTYERISNRILYPDSLTLADHIISYCESDIKPGSSKISARPYAYSQMRLSEAKYRLNRLTESLNTPRTTTCTLAAILAQVNQGLDRPTSQSLDRILAARCARPTAPEARIVGAKKATAVKKLERDISAPELAQLLGSEIRNQMAGAWAAGSQSSDSEGVAILDNEEH